MSLPASYLLALAVIAAVGSGVVAGLLFAFSTSVMKGLERLPPEQGMRAMQYINVAIINPTFLAVFLGTAVVCAVLAFNALLNWSAPASAWLLAGAATYLIGTFGVTMAVNVPLNNLLAASDASANNAAETWRSFMTSWLRWNHFRTLMGSAAALSFTIAATHLRSVAA